MHSPTSWGRERGGRGRGAEEARITTQGRTALPELHAVSPRGRMCRPCEEMSDPRSTLRSVGPVIDLEAWRSRRELTVLPHPSAGDTGAEAAVERRIGRLETAIVRLGHLVTSGRYRIGRRVETELLAITGAVSAGRVEEAAERADRLTERLEHPSSLAR